MTETETDALPRCADCGVTIDWLEEPRHAESHMTFVLPRLYVGAEWNANNQYELQRCGVDRIINVARELNHVVEHKKNTVITRYKFRLHDSVYEMVLPDLLRCVALLQQLQPHCVLVHCVQGRSRSPSAILAYMMWSQSKRLSAAVAELQAKRPCVSPNAGYMLQLHAVDVLFLGLKYGHTASACNALTLIADYLFC